MPRPGNEVCRDNIMFVLIQIVGVGLASYDIAYAYNILESLHQFSYSKFTQEDQINNPPFLPPYLPLSFPPCGPPSLFSTTSLTSSL